MANTQAQRRGTQRRTIHYFTWLRALGAVGIVVLHAFVSVWVAQGFEALGPVRVAVEQTVSIVVSRWAVPVFFMMSGALMLDPARPMGWRKMLRHVWRLGFVLLTIGFAFCLIESVVTHRALGMAVFWEAVANLLAQRSWDHLWFVYELLGYYLMTPLIRPWVAQASREEYRRVVLVTCALLLGTSAASAVLPFELYAGVSLPRCFAYYLMGPYVHRYLRLSGRWVAAGVASLLATVVLAAGLGQVWATEPGRGIVAPYAVLVMLLAKRLLDRPVRERSVVGLLGSYSFGIYLLHPLFMHAIVAVVDVMRYPALLVDVVLSVVPLVLSMALVWLLRHLPGFADKL